MDALANQVDRIINRILTSMLPVDLTFERALTPVLIAYTLQIDKINVGFIEIETVTSPSLGVAISFTVIPTHSEISLEIRKINDLIMQTIQLETGAHCWKELTPTPEIEQKLFGDPSPLPDQNQQPWDKIPDHLWDRLAIKLWCAGYTNQEIAKRVKVQPRSVTNRISELRKRYPHAGIPTHAQRIKLMILDDTG